MGTPVAPISQAPSPPKFSASAPPIPQASTPPAAPPLLASRLADSSMLDFSLTSPVSRKALEIAPDLAFADAMANPVCKYGYSAESLTAIRLKTEQLTYDDDV